MSVVGEERPSSRSKGSASNRAAEFLAGLGSRRTDGSSERRRGISNTGSPSGRTSRSGLDNRPSENADREGSRAGSVAQLESSRLDMAPGSRSSSRNSARIDRDRLSSRNSVLSKDDRRSRRRRRKDDDDVDDSAPASSVPSTPGRHTPNGTSVVTNTSVAKDNKRPPLDLKISRQESNTSFSERLKSPENFLNSRSSTPRGSGIDQRSLAVEKEVIESQVRRLQVENSSLQTENKWLKEKYNKAQEKIQDLEVQLEEALSQADVSKGDLSRELQKLKRRSRETSDREQEQLNDRLVKLSKENDMLKAENGSLEKQLELARSSSDALHTLSFSDRSKILDAYKMEATSLKDELKRVKELLNQSERSLHQEVDLRKETAKKLAEVTEFNNILKQQLDSGNEGSTAEKKVKSLEQRLKITEERLHQERADRASKLSEVEDKLLNDNAKLQVEAKESKRQLTREKEKYKTLDTKFKDLRGKKDSNFSSGDGRAIHEYEEEIKVLKDKSEDLRSAKEQGDTVHRQQIKELTEEKHSYFGKCKTLEDLLAARQAEVDSLRRSLGGASGPSSGPDKGQNVNNLKGQIESLKADVDSLETKVQQKQRANQRLEAELESLRSQLEAKQVSIDELNAELRSTNQMKGDGNSDLKQQKIDRLIAETRDQATELELFRSKQDKWGTEKRELEELLDEARRESDNSRNKKQHESRSVQSLESQKQALEKELTEKDALLIERTAQFHEAEDNLQQTRQDLVMAQDQLAELESEVEGLQSQLSQEARRNQRLTSSEQDVQQELDSLRENLRTVNKELTQKNTELKLLNVEMKREKARVEKLEQDVEKKSQQVEKYQSELLEKDMKANSLSSQSRLAEDNVAEMRRKVSSLEGERDSLKQDLTKANNSLDTMVMENSGLLKQVRETKQESAREKASSTQHRNELREVEQRLQAMTEEREVLRREKAQLEVDLSKREEDLRRTISKVEDEAKTQKARYEDEYQNLSMGGKMLSDELEKTKRLCDAKEKEVEMLNDNLSRQKQELTSQRKKIEALEDDIENVRGDLERSRQELANKVKESEGHVEVTQYLSSEKQQLQMDKYKLEKDLTTERAELDRREIEIDELKKKLDKAAEKHQLLEKECNEKDAVITTLHAERRHDNSRIAELDSDSYALQQKIEKLNEEITRLGNVNTSLEKKLDAEKGVVGEEKNIRNQLREELSLKKKDYEVLKYEFDKLSNNTSGDKKTLQSLKEENRKLSDSVDQLQDKVRAAEQQVASLSALHQKEAEGREQVMKDKQSLYSDLQELCVKLAQKDDTIAKLQEEADTNLSRVRSDWSSEKYSFNKEREDLELTLRRTKYEVEELNENLKKKDVVIGTLNKNLRELEDEQRLRNELEVKVRSLESEVDDAGLQRANLKGETLVLTDTNKQLQENIQKVKAHNATLKDELRTSRENSNREIRELKLHLSEVTNKAESQERMLKDQLTKATSELKASQASMDAHAESKAHLQVTTRSLEKTLDAIKSQLHEEVTMRKLAEQKLESLQTSSDQLRKAKILNEDQNEGLVNQINQLEPALKTEKDKLRKLQAEYDELSNVSVTNEQRAKLLDGHIQELQSEISNLQTSLENQKQHLTGKNKKANLELKQQIANFETERGKLIIQNQQLTSQLERSRDQLAEKNRENLRLQEEALAAEEKAREMKASLIRSEEGLKSEKELQNKLAERNSSLVSELSRLRNVANKLDDAENVDKVNTLKNEMSRQLQEITLRLQMELNKDKGDGVSTKQMEDYKRKLNEIQSALSTEQTLHAVTKSSLKSSEEDNQRLRLQLMMYKRKDSPAQDRSGQSRMDKINEIIAKAQTQAQAMMSTGTYPLPFSDDMHRTMTPTRDFGNTLFRGTMASPDPLSVGSDRPIMSFHAPNRG